MDINRITLRNLPEGLDSEADVRRLMIIFGLIATITVQSTDRSAVVEFVNPISANRAYYEAHQSLAKQSIQMEYEVEQPPESTYQFTAAQNDIPLKQFKPYTYQKNRQKELTIQQQLHQNWKMVAIMVVVFVVVLWVLRVSVYLPIKRRVFPDKSRRTNKPTKPNHVTRKTKIQTTTKEKGKK